MTIELEERLERLGNALPTPSEAVTAGARRRVRAAVAQRSRHGIPQPGRHSRRRLGLVALGAGAAVAGVLLVLASPWQGRSPLATERALAAIGDQPVIHAVVERTRPYATIIDLGSGAERALFQRTEYWYDDERSLLRARVTIDGNLLTELLQTRDGGLTDLGPVPGGPLEPRLDPALAGFAGRYREALESGEARVIGESSVDGRHAILLQIALAPATERQPTGYEEVAIDADTYRPLRFRRHSGQRESQWWRVVAIETVARGEQQFAAPSPVEPRPNGQTGTVERMLTPAEAAAALERPAIWPGQSVDGIDLRQIRYMKLTTRWTDGRESTNRALVFEYGADRFSGLAEPWLTVTEGTSRQETLRFRTFANPALVSGQLELVGLGDLDDMWLGLMELDGIYIVLESPQRDVVLDAARAMMPIR